MGDGLNLGRFLLGCHQRAACVGDSHNSSQSESLLHDYLFGTNTLNLFKLLNPKKTGFKL